MSSNMNRRGKLLGNPRSSLFGSQLPETVQPSQLLEDDPTQKLLDQQNQEGINILGNNISTIKQVSERIYL